MSYHWSYWRNALRMKRNRLFNVFVPDTGIPIKEITALIDAKQGYAGSWTHVDSAPRNGRYFINAVEMRINDSMETVRRELIDEGHPSNIIIEEDI